MAYRSGARMVTYTPSFPPFNVVFQIVMLAVRVVTRCLYGLRIRGRKNLHGVPRAVLVSNHSLVLDPALIAHAIRPRRTYFTMLEETALIPFLGTFVRLLGGIPLARGPGAVVVQEHGIEDAIRILGLVHFFPEGECYLRNQQIMPFHRGAFRAACHHGLPVVPVATVLQDRGGKLTGRFWRQLGLPPRTTIVISQPLYPSTGLHGRAAEAELSDRTREVIQSVIDRECGDKTMSRGVMPRLALHRVPADEKGIDQGPRLP